MGLEKSGWGDLEVLRPEWEEGGLGERRIPGGRRGGGRRVKSLWDGRVGSG